MEKNDPHFLVLGSGVGGICSAIDLAEAGCSVTLVEKGPRTGGILPQLDHQFPDDHCGMCRLLPMVDRDPNDQTCLKRGLFHDRIRILTRTTLTDLSGEAGKYTATLTTLSSGVDAERCTRCLDCVAACPEAAPDRFNDRIGTRKAIYRPLFGNPDALPSVDWDRCTRCEACVKACPSGAIDLERRETSQTLEPLAGVIVSGGNDLYDPANTDLYGYGVLPNVVTATAFERMLSGSGPYGGMPVRPSDGKPIRRIAWIQCVGSRNVMIGAGHCSSTCCMFALKEALLAKTVLGRETETVLFYMDMRTAGRDFQRYRDRAEESHGVRLIRCRIHSVEPADAPGDLRLTYLDETGQPSEAQFDLVVLSTGAGTQQPLPSFLEDRLAQEGVVLLGPEAGLQDIRETVLKAHASVTALLRSVEAADHRASSPTAADRSAEQAESRLRQQPTVQVVLLDNTLVRTPPVDWPALESTIAGLPGRPLISRLNLAGLDPPLELATLLDQTRGNRLLVVSNQVGANRKPLTRLFGRKGFIPALVDWVDLNRDDLGMGHTPDSPDIAMRSIRAAMMRLLHKRPVREVVRAVERGAMVIGAGPAGLSAAVNLADQGVAVQLVEKSGAIGGNGLYIVDEEQRRPIEQLIAVAKQHPRITLHTAASLASVSGAAGHFEGWIVKEDGETPVAFGALVMATGGGVASTDAYGLGRYPRLVSHFEFEKQTLDPRFANEPLDTVVMIQCAGSREEPRNYCSRTCCMKSLENAIRVRRHFPEARIVVFYRDIMTPGTAEALYAAARTHRIRFVPFHKSHPPAVRPENDHLTVDGFDPVMGEALHLKVDWVSLAVGMDPAPVHELCRMVAVPVTPDGFVAEADAKWRPVDTINPGVFVCGLAKGPLPVREAVAEGGAAALRALRLLRQNQVTAPRRSAIVRHAICSRCYLCVDACPYGARVVDPVLGQVTVEPVGCQGCGTCAAVCPNSATIMGEHEDFTVMGIIEAALS